MDHVSAKAVPYAARDMTDQYTRDDLEARSKRRIAQAASTWYDRKYGWVRRYMTTGTSLSVYGPTGSV